MSSSLLAKANFFYRVLCIFPPEVAVQYHNCFEIQFVSVWPVLRTKCCHSIISRVTQ